MQYLLILGAIVLLSSTTLAINTLIVETQDDLQKLRLTLPAVHAAHSLVEWGASLRFDEKGGFLDPLWLTDWDELGPDPGETEESFDDVDDLDGYTRTYSDPPVTATVHVSYVAGDDLDQPVQTRTSYKLMTIDVTGEYLLAPLHYRAVFAAGL